jgi:hypothetical protein
LHMASDVPFHAESPVPPSMSKSFLVLFFKKELLPYLTAPCSSPSMAQ